MKPMPLVGITTTRRKRENGTIHHYVSQSYTQALIASSIIPVIISNDLDEEALRGIYQRIDGVLLSGGGDVAPQRYGVAADDRAKDIDEERDRTEIQLACWAYAEDKPFFAICRGIQVMNVALGGTLIGDIPSTIGTMVTHWPSGYPEGDGRSALLHSVQIESGTFLEAVAKSSAIRVNSIHHQAVDQVASNLRPTAYAPDGVIEGLEAPGARFFAGVQWHPEEIFHVTPETQALFHAFSQAL